AYANVRSVSQIVLNPDPNGTLLGNADGTNPATTPDVVDNNQGIAGDEEPATVLVDVNPLTISTTAYALSNAGTTNLAFNNLALNNQSVVDTTVTITNDGNTDTTLALKTLLNSGNIPPGMSIQLLLRKVALSPAASADPSANTIGSCSIGVVQQNSQVASFAQPETIAPTDAGLITFPSASPGDQNADPLAATLPLSAKEKAYVTLRVVGPSCVVGRPVIECATYLFAKYG